MKLNPANPASAVSQSPALERRPEVEALEATQPGVQTVSSAWAALKPDERILVETTLRLLKLSPECGVRLSPKQLRALLERFASYNNMRNMESLCADIDPLMPRHHYPRPTDQPANPNHGAVAHTYLVGNSSSLKVVVRLPSLRGLARVDLNALTLALNQVALEHGADEYGRVLNDDFGFAFRLWWD